MTTREEAKPGSIGVVALASFVGTVDGARCGNVSAG
jgi:hypothetical protein